MNNGARRSASVDLLRHAFDNSFAAPIRLGTEDAVDLLALRVAGDAYAVRLGDVSGLLVDRRLVPLPATLPEFLGLTGVKGGVIPVWSLRALLGAGADHDFPRWMILVSGQGRGETLALAFERFDGHLMVPRAQLSERPPTEPDQGAGGVVRIRHSVRANDGPRGVLDVATIIDDIKRRLGPSTGKAHETVNEAR